VSSSGLPMGHISGKVAFIANFRMLLSDLSLANECPHICKILGVLESDEFGCATKVAVENEFDSDKCPETLQYLETLLTQGKIFDIKKVFRALITALEAV